MRRMSPRPVVPSAPQPGAVPPDHDEIVARAAALVPALRERAQKAESLRRLPDETMAEVEEADLLRTMVPRRWGGHGLGLRTVCQLTRVLAQGCPSTAWVVGFLVEHNWQFARFGATVQEEIFGSQPLIRAPAQLAPVGRLEPVDGGFRLSGRWEFCSGVMHADWTILAAVATPAEPAGPDARPTPYVLIAPMADVAVEDVWHTAGMRATGSNAIVAEDVFVPAHRVVAMREFVSEDNPGVALHDEPVVRLPAGAVADRVRGVGRGRLGRTGGGALPGAARAARALGHRGRHPRPPAALAGPPRRRDRTAPHGPAALERRP